MTMYNITTIIRRVLHVYPILPTLIYIYTLKIYKCYQLTELAEGGIDLIAVKLTETLSCRYIAVYTMKSLPSLLK